MNDFLKRKESKPNLQPNTIATIPQLRMTCMILPELYVNQKTYNSLRKCREKDTYYEKSNIRHFRIAC